MALRRYTKEVDGSIPVQALLYDDEELLGSQDGVGIYDGLQKSMQHQNGTIHVTTHRMFYINDHKTRTSSFQTDLSFITQTEYYAGLFKSSPKITCHLSGCPSGVSSAEQEGTYAQFESWECQVCAYRNPPGLSPAAARICALCGVPRTATPTPIPSVSSRHLSSFLSTSALSTSSLPSGPVTNQTSIACPACTFLNYPSMRTCEMCSTDLPQARPELISAPSSRAISPEPEDEDDDGTASKMVKISFRKGGDKLFYSVLRRSLKSKSWEVSGLGPSSANGVNGTGSEPRHTVGISGILRTVETSAKGRETHMKDALQDLEALRVKAKDMVKLAAELNEKLTAISASTTNTTSSHQNLTLLPSVTEPEEATFIRSSLSQLGLQISNIPVTLDMMKDERRWFDELARELAGVLQGSTNPARSDITTTGGMMKTRGIIALDEVWGGWNRARGVALIPPSTLLQVVSYLPAHTNPAISHRSFASGLNVLHTPPYTQAAFGARLSSFLMINGPKTTIEVSQEEGLTVALVSEMIDAMEQESGVCRDDSGAALIGGGGGTGVEIRWWTNVFYGYIWDGQE